MEEYVNVAYSIYFLKVTNGGSGVGIYHTDNVATENGTLGGFFKTSLIFLNLKTFIFTSSLNKAYIHL